MKSLFNFIWPMIVIGLVIFIVTLVIGVAVLYASEILDMIFKVS